MEDRIVACWRRSRLAIGEVPMSRFLPVALALTAAAAAAGPHGSKSPTLTPQQSGTTSRLQAVSVVNPKVVWASGLDGTFVLTTDGGRTWRARVVPGAETLQFRDVEGVSERVAYLLSAGSGEASRIYKTEDGGETWSLQFQNEDPDAFYDCFAFWTPKRGLTMSDAVNGRFPVIRTTDGETWQDIGDNLPPAQPGEAAFAASGTCVAVQGGKRGWIGTGGAPAARILATVDGGRTWAAYGTPIVQGTPTSGVITVGFRDPSHGILGGGEILAPTVFADTVARTRDGGRTWRLVSRPPFPGAVYGLSYVGGGESAGHDHAGSADADDHGHDGSHGEHARRTVVITGPSGAAWSPDEGDTWSSLPGVANYWAVAFAGPRAGWLVGTEGRILKISF
jgi:photosystem II stability/assembly factor-like uncharacterized protein